MIIARWTSETLFNARRYRLIPKKLLYKKWLLIVSVTRTATSCNDILQRYHPYRQSYTRKKRNVSLVLGHQSMLITIFNTSDSQLQSSKVKGSFDQFTCLRINPFHLRKDMLIYTEFKSWVYCAATVEISSDTQILVAPQCAITDSLLNARKSGNIHSSAL